MRIIQQAKNAIAVIRQIRRDEWEFCGHFEYEFTDKFTCYIAKRGELELWCGNGMFSCQIRDQPWQLGIFGPLVWVAAAGKRARMLERMMRRAPSNLAP